MGKKALTTRFDRPLMESMAKELTEGTPLTVSEIHRAAMIQGLAYVNAARDSMIDGEFISFIADNQEPKA